MLTLFYQKKRKRMRNKSTTIIHIILTQTSMGISLNLRCCLVYGGYLSVPLWPSSLSETLLGFLLTVFHLRSSLISFWMSFILIRVNSKKTLHLTIANSLVDTESDLLCLLVTMLLANAWSLKNLYCLSHGDRSNPKCQTGVKYTNI